MSSVEVYIHIFIHSFDSSCAATGSSKAWIDRARFGPIPAVAAKSSVRAWRIPSRLPNRERSALFRMGPIPGRDSRGDSKAARSRTFR